VCNLAVAETKIPQMDSLRSSVETSKFRMLSAQTHCPRALYVLVFFLYALDANTTGNYNRGQDPGRAL
jgi:hypothetical protein